MKILVVDDNTDAADSLAMLLHAWGHTVIACYTAMDGITEAERMSPGVIIHDLNMPGLDRFGAVSRVRAHPMFAHTLIIAVTAYDNAKARSRAKSAGFDDFFKKPADSIRLRGVLRTWEANMPQNR